MSSSVPYKLAETELTRKECKSELCVLDIEKKTQSGSANVGSHASFFRCLLFPIHTDIEQHLKKKMSSSAFPKCFVFEARKRIRVNRALHTVVNLKTCYSPMPTFGEHIYFGFKNTLNYSEKKNINVTRM